jgi:hypothetical protein
MAREFTAEERELKIAAVIAEMHNFFPAQNLEPLQRYKRYREEEAAPYLRRSVRQMKRDREDHLHAFYTMDGETPFYLGEDIALLHLEGRVTRGSRKKNGPPKPMEA